MMRIRAEIVIRLAGMALRLTGREYETDLENHEMGWNGTGLGGKALRPAEMILRLAGMGPRLVGTAVRHACP